MGEVTIVWSAFGGSESLTFEQVYSTGDKSDDYELCERLFRITNLQEESADPLWSLLKRHLPDKRTHTSLSVGDQIIIDGRSYYCASSGWSTSPPGTCVICRVAALQSNRTVCQRCEEKNPNFWSVDNEMVLEDEL